MSQSSTKPSAYCFPQVPLDQAECERIALLYLKENPERTRVDSVQTTGGFYAYTINGQRWRDRERILSAIDLEAVMLHYGLELDFAKTTPGSGWRVYRWAHRSTKQRIGVMHPTGYDYKLFGFINTVSLEEDTATQDQFPTKGNVFNLIQLIEKDRSRVYPKIDELAQSIEFHALSSTVDELPTTMQATENSRGYTDHGRKLREESLLEEYPMNPIMNSEYLIGRGIPALVQERASFWGKIQFVKHSFVDAKSTNRVSYYTGFPLTGVEGSLLSISLRNKKSNLFPRGIRADALWVSNKRGILLRTLQLKDTTLEKGTSVYYHLTEKNVYLSSTKFRIVIRREYWDKQLQTGELIQPQQAERIVIGEGPIDVISHSILFPQKKYTLYVATCGRISRLGADHLRTIISENPQATLILANDNDVDGLRFSLNYLNFAHQLDRHNEEYTIRVRVKYLIPEDEQELGTTYITLQMHQSLKASVRLPDANWMKELLQSLIEHGKLHAESASIYFSEEPYTEVQVVGSSLVTHGQLCFPDRSLYLREVLFSLLTQIRMRQGDTLLEATPYQGATKDFNEWLQAQQQQPETI